MPPSKSAAAKLRAVVLPRIPVSAVAVCLALVAGCATVGPNFHLPPAQAVPAENPYTPEPTPAQTTSAPGVGGAAQRFTAGGDIPEQWWTLFRSEPLDQLV